MIFAQNILAKMPSLLMPSYRVLETWKVCPFQAFKSSPKMIWALLKHLLHYTKIFTILMLAEKPYSEHTATFEWTKMLFWQQCGVGMVSNSRG